jgi:RNA polymerase sigma-70 factor (ECF subfamily)
MSADTGFADRTDAYRSELLAHCYRMVGSVHDAEDLVQETYLRAWRGYPDFEERSSLRTWLYRIATNVCLTALASRDRRLLPSGLVGPSTDVPGTIAARLLEVAWLEPIADSLLGDDPASIIARRESTRLAFVAALQHLPPRQRATLLLRDVVGMSAAETAALLGLSTAAANSALQRARGHIAQLAPTEDETASSSQVDREILERFVAAFDRLDIGALARMLSEDVELEMPPVPMWFAGSAAALTFFERYVFQVPRRHLPTRANGAPALASYRLERDGHFHAHNVLTLQLRDGAVRHMCAFLDPSLFPLFGMPLTVAG